MKIKLDENLSVSAKRTLTAADLDVTTVVEENLCGATDRQIFNACRSENLCLVTLDKGFSNPLKFNPTGSQGIVVLRISPPMTRHEINGALQIVTNALIKASVAGKLWVISKGKIREYKRGSS